MRADQWASYCLTWQASRGLQLLVNGIDMQLTAPTSTDWSRSYTALSCRLTVCRYASDMATEFRVAGRYDFGEMPFSDVFYYPAALEADVLPSYVGLSGALRFRMNLNFGEIAREKSSTHSRHTSTYHTSIRVHIHFAYRQPFLCRNSADSDAVLGCRANDIE